MKELLVDKNRLKIDVRIVYGKNELQPQEIEWLRGLTYIRTSFCKNLHAKCYLNEETCIVTSLNLYEFSQVNNNEMGVLISRSEDAQLYKDAYEEAQRIIRISDEVRMSLERIAAIENSMEQQNDSESSEAESGGNGKVSSSKVAQRMGMKTAQFLALAIELGYLEYQGDKQVLTQKGEKAGGEFVAKSRFGPYFVWPHDVVLS